MSLRPPTRLLSLLALAGLASCGKLKQKETPAPKPAIVPEIVAETDAPPAQVQSPLDPTIPALTINKSAQVSILGYHDFIRGKSSDEMQINASHFRDQMQALKDARLPVISMKDFLAWRRGEKDVPDPSVVITIDDGWKSVHSIAFPVLKEFGYPFTIYLYKRFVNGGGRALTTPEIREMMASGCEIGSHSVSHSYGGAINSAYRKSKESGEAYLRVEMVDSRQFLEDLFAVKVTTYAYPGGYFNPAVEEMGKTAGYEALFTVNPGRTTWDTPFTTLPRYIINGEDLKDINFRRAITSRGTSGGQLVKQLLSGEGEAMVKTNPEANATIASRLPLLEVDVSKLDGIDPQSIVMKVAGFGQVPAVYDPQEKKISCHMQEKLRTSKCQVSVTFKRLGEAKPEVVAWEFSIDMAANYLPEEPGKLEKAVPVDTLAAPDAPAEPAAH